MVHVILDAEPTVPPGRIRVKIETNIAETEPFRQTITLPLAIESEWFTGRADIPTYTVEELMGTKLRALYQREKGRDLFDLWLVLRGGTNSDEITGAFHHYMREDAFSYPELRQNLRAKLESREFNSDLETLVTQLPAEYDAAAAGDLVMELLGSRLRNAAALQEIRAGGWRR